MGSVLASEIFDALAQLVVASLDRSTKTKERSSRSSFFSPVACPKCFKITFNSSTFNFLRSSIDLVHSRFDKWSFSRHTLIVISTINNS